MDIAGREFVSLTWSTPVRRVPASSADRNGNRSPVRGSKGGPMNTPKAKNKTVRSGQHPGEPESPATLATFPQRTKRPGQVGLANEARPGLGTRAADENPDEQKPAPKET